MSSPITSVPEPSESASTSSDPLAGVITQVSPRQAAAPIRGGPARPTKVAKQGTAKAANLDKKKKKKSVAGTPADDTTDKGITEKVSEVKDEGTSNREEGTAGPSADPLSEGEASNSHSQNPSSTVVGTTTTQPSTLTMSESGEAGGKDKPSDAALTPTEPAPSKSDLNMAGGASGQQDMAEAAQKLSKPSVSSKPSGGKNTVSNEKMEMSEKGSTPQAKSAPATTSKGKEKQKQKGIVARIVAILTCSSATGAMVAAESEDEKRLVGDKNVTRSPATNGNVNRGDVKKSARSKGLPASNKGSMERNASSAGGGTILSKEETGDVMSGAVVPPGSSFVPHDTEKRSAAAGGLIGAGVALGAVAMHKQDDTDDEDGDEDDEWMGEEMQEDEDQTEEQRLIQQGGVGIPKDENGNERPLLGPIGPEDTGRKCLVLDLDETLVHSSFKMISNADFIVPVEIEGTVHNVYVIKRPGVDEFMRQMGEIYEVVVFTASLAKYADPVLDILDIHQVVRHRLFRESCYNHKGNYVKDLSQLGREIHTSIIIDNSPASYIFHPNNAVPISSWFNDPHDTELTDLCPFLAELADVDDVRAVLDGLL